MNAQGRHWCEGRHWPGRLVVLLGMVYVAWSHLAYHTIQYPYGNVTFSIWQNPTWLLDLTVHEMGHALFMGVAVFGLESVFLIALGGTLFQLGLPVIAIGMFLRQRDGFAVTFAVFWLAVNLYYVQWYISDARAEAQPLLKIWGENVEHIHDWNYLLGRAGWLDYDLVIGTVVRWLALILMWGAIAGGGWMIGLMMRSRRSE